MFFHKFKGIIEWNILYSGFLTFFCDIHLVFYFDFSTAVTITGADINNYLGNFNITVTGDTANDLGGALSGLTTNGTIALNMFFKSEGLKKLTASCGGVSGSLNITVLQEKLSISMSSPPPSKSNETLPYSH